MALSSVMSIGPDRLDIHPERRQHVKPIMVASLEVASMTGRAERPAHAMAITLDLDAVPGLRQVFERQRAGEDFDVISRWGAAVDTECEEAPYALVDFYLPEVDIGVEIAIEVDRYPDSLLAGIRSGTVYLIDPELAGLLQKQDIAATLDEYKPLVLQLPDSKPVIGVLQQRFDFPREIYEPERRAVTPETHRAEVEAFIAGAKAISLLAVQYNDAATPTIVIVEPSVSQIRAGLVHDAHLEGRWALLAGSERNVLRFDGFADGAALGRWLLPRPSETLIRAGASGAHAVAIIAERPSADQQEAERQWHEGIHLWVPHVEVFRALLLELPRDQSAPPPPPAGA
jgi:hypothetical protein